MTEWDRIADWFVQESWPTLSCPACRRGDLAPVRVDTVDSAATERMRADGVLEPEWIRGAFTAHLRCHRAACAEPVVALGEMKVEFRATPGGDTYDSQFETLLLLRQVIPAPPLVEVVGDCPVAVQERLDEAARVVLVDPNAAANRLRFAVEGVLDDQGVARKPSRGTRELTTHQRIVEFGKVNQDVAEVLEAVKWIGNQGSHEDSLAPADVVEGAHILEHALALLYDRSAAEIVRRARGINADKGVRRPPAAASGP